MDSDIRSVFLKKKFLSTIGVEDKKTEILQQYKKTKHNN